MITSAVFDHIVKECDCIIEEEAIDQDHLVCDRSQLNIIVFRAKIATHQLTRDNLFTIIQSLVTAGRLMLSDSTILRLDNSCPVEISSLNDPVCTSPITENVEDEETQSNENSPTAIIAGIVVATIVVIVMLLFVLLLMLYWRTKHR